MWNGIKTDSGEVGKKKLGKKRERDEEGTAPPKREGGGGRLQSRRAGGYERYPEGTNCSGVRRGVVPARILPTHTRSQKHTHAHTHIPPGLAISVWRTLPTVPPPLPPTPNHPHPHNPSRPNLESVYSDNSGAKFALLPALLLYVSLSETRVDWALDMKNDYTSHC